MPDQNLRSESAEGRKSYNELKNSQKKKKKKKKITTKNTHTHTHTRNSFQCLGFINLLYLCRLEQVF